MVHEWYVIHDNRVKIEDYGPILSSSLKDPNT